MSENTEERIDSGIEESGAGSRDVLVAEAREGQPELVDRQRTQSGYIKDGGRSGVTGEFGKPELVDDTSVGGAPAASDAPPRKLRRDPNLSDMSLLPDAADGRDYRGEDIKLSVEPGRHTCQAGETLSKIASDHLGPFATEDQIKAYVKEIQAINGLWREAAEHNKVISLPGHTSDGKLIYLDADGTERTVHADGSYDIEFTNGSTVSRKYQADGSYIETRRSKTGEETSFTHKPGPPADKSGYVEEHTGAKPGDKYTVEKMADGRYKIKDGSGERLIDKHDEAHPDIRVERARLRDLAREKISDPAERKRFEQDMDRFEERSRQLEDVYMKRNPGMRPEQAKKLAQEEVGRSYLELSKVLEAPDNPNLASDKRTKIVQQFMSHAADPTTIDQGLHPTCQTNTVEVRTFTTDPSKAARLIADITTKGEYTTPDGKTTVKLDSTRGSRTTPDGKTRVNVDPKSLFDPLDSSMQTPPIDGERSYVSKVFQVTAINVELARTGHLDTKGKPIAPYKPGDVQYVEQERNASLNPPDTGSRLVDSSGKEITDGSGKPVMSPSLTEDQISDMSNAITGRNEKVVIDFEDYVCGDGKNVIKVKTEAELEEALRKAKERGQLPIVVKIDPVNQPFWSDSGAGVGGSSPYAGAVDQRRQPQDVATPQVDSGVGPKPGPGPGPGQPERLSGSHVVTITDYEPAVKGPPAKPSRVEIDNSWGRKSDHVDENAVTTHDLFLAMHPSGHQKGDRGRSSTNDGIIDLLEQDVKDNPANTRAQLELLRQKALHDPPLVEAAEYDTKVASFYQAALERWKDEESKGTIDRQERDKTEEELYSMLINLPKHRQEAILTELLKTSPELREEYSEWQTGIEPSRPYWLWNTLLQLWDKIFG